MFSWLKEAQCILSIILSCEWYYTCNLKLLNLFKTIYFSGIRNALQARFVVSTYQQFQYLLWKKK